jgi:hypothetical protein
VYRIRSSLLLQVITRVSKIAWFCFGLGLFFWGLALRHAYTRIVFERENSAERNMARAPVPPRVEPKTSAANGAIIAQGVGDLVRRVAGAPPSPLARELRGKEAKYNVRSKYLPLYKQLSLSPEQRERFEQVLLDQLGAADLVLSGVLGAPPHLEKQRYSEAYEALEAAMHAAAGQEAAATIREYVAYGEIRDSLMSGIAETYYDNNPLSPADVDAVLDICKRLHQAPNTGRPLKPREVNWHEILREGGDKLTPAATSRIAQIAAIAEFDREYWRLTGVPVRPMIRGW